MLAHRRIRQPESGHEPTGLVFAHPDLDLSWITESPLRLLGGNRLSERLSQVCPEERTFLEHPGDHTVSHPSRQGAMIRRPDGQSLLDSLRAPYSPGDGMRLVAAGSYRPADLHKQILDCAQRPESLSVAAVDFKKDEVGAPVESDVGDLDPRNTVHHAADKSRHTRYNSHKHASYSRTHLFLRLRGRTTCSLLAVLPVDTWHRRPGFPGPGAITRWHPTVR